MPICPGDSLSQLLPLASRFAVVCATLGLLACGDNKKVDDGPFFESRSACRDASELAEYTLTPAAETGPVAFSPLDTDGDGLPDLEDPDNDGDGLLDIYDAEPFVPLSTVIDPDNMLWIIASYLERDSNIAMGVALAGETTVVRGRGIGSCDVVISIDDGAGNVANLRPTRVGKNSVEFSWPELAGATLRIIDVAGQRSSNVEPVVALPSGSPVLFTPQNQGSVGESSKLEGLNLSDVDLIRIGDDELSPEENTPNSVAFMVSAGRGERVSVLAGSQESNSVQFFVTQPVSIDIELPRSFGDENGASLANSIMDFAKVESAGPTLVRTRATRLDTVSLISDNEELLLQAMVLPGQESVTIDSESSAIALALQASDATRGESLETIESFMGQVAALPAIVELASSIEAATTPASVWLAPSSELTDQTVAAASSVQELMTSLAPPASARSRRGAGNAVDAENDIAIYPSREQYPFTLSPIPARIADLQLDNPTQMAVSLRMQETATGTTLVEHAESLYARDVVAATKTKPYLHPGGRPVDVQVVTPGISGDQPTDVLGKRAQAMMRFRTAIERFIYPVIEKLLPLDDAPLLTKLIISNAPDIIAEFQTHADNGDINAALRTVFELLKDDFTYCKGDICKALVEVAGKAAIEKAGEKLVAYVVPGVGTLQLILESISIAITINKALDAISQIRVVPGVFEWQVAYEFGITSIFPDEITQVGDSYDMEIEGVGFFPKFVDGEFLFPDITITDLGGATEPQTISLSAAHEAGELIIRAGRKIEGGWIEISSRMASQAVGPLEVKLTRGPDEAVGPPIPVIRTLEIDSILPAVQRPGETITITGKGFDAVKALGYLDFYFRAADGSVVQNQPASIVAGSLTATQAEIVIPALPDAPAGNPDDSFVWNLYAEGGPVGFPVRSNPAPFLRSPALSISALSPAAGLAGQPIRITGVGFISDLANMRVLFQDAGAPGTVLEATITGSASESGLLTAIDATVPVGVSDQTSWLVSVEQTPSGQPLETSNQLPFEGSAEILIVASRATGDLFEVNTTTGELTLLLNTFTDNGGAPVDVGSVSSIIYVPTQDQLWYGNGGQSFCGDCLQVVNRTTGEAVTLQALVGGDAVAGLTLRQSDGLIVGTYGDSSGLRSFDPVTGVEIQIATSAISGAGGRALTFANDGTLYEGGDGGFFSWNLATGEPTLISALSHVGFPAFGNSNGSIVAMATRADGQMFCLVKDFTSSGGTVFLATVDPATAVVTHIAALPLLVEGLAFVPASIFP